MPPPPPQMNNAGGYISPPPSYHGSRGSAYSAYNSHAPHGHRRDRHLEESVIPADSGEAYTQFNDDTISTRLTVLLRPGYP
ncbi:hypothetical protein B0H10DRAFT_684395 [Mycena sp. CBHHK59/15]|nr:hypothetical protein B0H10DRAFT_684395 [Mycena sp. CBHHK59/15]